MMPESDHSALLVPMIQTWEPHIKPELKKAQHAAKSWFNKQRSRNASPIEAQPPMRAATPEAHDPLDRRDGGNSPFREGAL